MSYTINKLSALKVRSVTRSGMYGDGAGLWLQVSKGGAKSWIFRYDFFGRRREMGLGSCHTVDLALAREKAKACRLVLLEKRDPIEERDKTRAEYVHQQAKRVTFDEYASAYIAAHRGSWKNAKHAAQWETTIAVYVSPIIGGLWWRMWTRPLSSRCSSPSGPRRPKPLRVGADALSPSSTGPRHTNFVATKIRRVGEDTWRT